ncbi:MAG: hypothetical protein ACI3V3_00895 [Faecousia sp.]
MKIKTKVMDYDRVLALPRPGHLPPLRPGFLFRLLIRAASVPELRATRFSWEEYRMERERVRRELLEGTYRLEAEVDIGMMVDYKAIYMVGKGHLTHDREGFTLTGCDGRLRYSQKPLSSYGLYADYFWYEIGDVICIGDRDCLYYCFPRGGDVVAKTRLAAEELYKLLKARTPLPTA